MSVSAERLYLNAAKDRVVREGDPSAAFLLVGADCEIPEEYEKLVKAFNGEKPEPEPEAEAAPEPEVEEKAVEDVPNKAVSKAANKGRAPRRKA